MILLRLIIIVILLSITTCSVYAVDIYIHTDNPNIEFMLVDYTGKKTGYDPIIKKHVSETKGLPMMNYKAIWDENPLATTPPPIESYGLQGVFPVNNVILDMQLMVTGIKISTSSIVLSLEEDDTGLPYPQYARSSIKPTLLDKDQVAKYEIHYIPLQSIAMIKVATSTDLIADITTAQKLNLIGNPHFVSETIEKINEIEKERLEPQKPDAKSDKEEKKDDKPKLTPAQKAKKEYTELLGEITEKYNKPEADEFVKQGAYTVLKEDLDYIISHL